MPRWNKLGKPSALIASIAIFEERTMIRQTQTPAWAEKSVAFLNRIWSYHSRSGYVFLAARHRTTGAWHEEAISLAPEFDCFEFFARFDRRDYDLYFCPNRFRGPRRLAKFGMPTPFAWCDVDEGSAFKCRPVPSLVWETSKGRTQALWVWSGLQSRDNAEGLSRMLTQQASGDRNGWSETKFLRIPFTYNHKPQYQRPIVRLLHEERDTKQRPPLIREVKSHSCSAPQRLGSSFDDLDSATVFRKVCLKLHPRVRALIRDKRVWVHDRSGRVFNIVADLHRVGATFEEIAAVLRSNVYFVSIYGSSKHALEREIGRILGKIEGNS